MKLTPEQLHEVLASEGWFMLPDAAAKLHAAIVAREKKPKGVHEFIKAYCDAWALRYGKSPLMNGRATGAAKRLVADLGQSRAIEVVEKYLTMNEAFFLQRRHDLVTLEANLNTIVAGNAVTRTQIQQVERRSNTHSQLDRIRKGDL